MNNSVDIFLLTYNRADYLKEAITSILAQTFSNFRLYVLDNCSTDNTVEIVRSFPDARITYIRHDTNLGGPGNINYAISHASSKYFVIFHDDDHMLPNMISDMVDYLSRNERTAAVSAKGIVIDENAERQGGYIGSYAEENMSWRGEEIFKEFLIHDSMCLFPSIMYRTDFIRKNNIFFSPAAGPCGDVVLYFDIGRHGGRIDYINDIVMEYRIHSGQDSHISAYSMHAELFEFLRADPYYSGLLARNQKYVSLPYILYVKQLLLGFIWNQLSDEQVQSIEARYRAVIYPLNGRAKLYRALLMYSMKHKDFATKVYGNYHFQKMRAGT